MEEQHQNIDDIFRQSLDDYREVPPAAAWNKVAARLDHEERSRRAGYFQRWPWIMMALLLLIGGAWFVRSMHGRGSGVDNKQEAAAEYTSTPTGFHEASPVSSLPPAADPGPQATATDPLSDNAEQEPIKEEIPVAAPDAPAQSDASAAIENDVDQPGIASAATSEPAAATQLPVAEPAKAPATVATLPQPAPKTTGTRGKLRVTTTAADSTLPKTSAVASSSITPAAPIAAAKKKNPEGYGQAPVAPPGKTSADPTAVAAASQDASQPGTKKSTPTGKTNTAKTVSSTDTGTNQPAVAKNVPVTPVAAAKKKASGNTTQAPMPASSKTTLSGAAMGGVPQNPNQPATKKTTTTGKANTAKTASSVDTGKNHTIVAKSATATTAAKKKATPTGKTNTAKSVSRTDTGTNQPAAVNKPVVSSIAATKAVQKKTAPATQPQPKKEISTSTTASTQKPAPTQKKTPAAKNDTSLKQTAPVIAAAAAPVNKQTPSAKKKPVADSVKSKQAKDGSNALPVAKAAPAAVKPPAANTKKQTKAVKSEVATSTTSSTPTANNTTPARKEPAAPALTLASAAATPMASEKPQPKAHTIDPLTTTQAQPPVHATTDTAAGTKPTDTAAAAAKPKYHISPSFSALGGYEFGMQSPAPGRITAAARLLFHVSPRASFGIQPAIRYGTVASQKLSDEKTYQQSVIDVASFTSLAVSPSIRNGIDTLYHYVIRETFDSIVVGSASIGGKSLEFELPLIVSYRLGNAWHVYGGPSMSFGGKLSSTAASTQTYTLTRKDSLVQSVPIPSSEFVNYFGKSSLEPYTNYQPSAAIGKDPASVRFGYIFGFGYDWKRFIFDASMHQQLSGYGDVAQPIQKVYSSPYLRMSFGYILFPEKKSQKNDVEP